MKTEKEQNGAIRIDHVISWIVLYYTGIVTFIVSPILLLCLFYLTLPITLFHLGARKLVYTVLARLSNLQFITVVRVAGIKVVMSGEKLERLEDCRALMLPNHLTLFDHFIFMTAAESFGIQAVGRWMFVIYNMWIYTPLGVLWGTYGNYFVDSVHPSKREMVLKNMREHFDAIYHERDLRWICLYPEGSRLFLIQKRNAEFAKKKELPALEHCVYPRLGAAHSAISVLGPDPNNLEKANNGKGAPLKYLVDVTLGYPDQAKNSLYKIFANAVMNPGKPFAIHYDIFDMNPKWNDEEEFKKFLFERYQKKDQLLAKYYETGEFAADAREAPMPSDLLIFSFQIVQWFLFTSLVRLIYFLFFY